MKLAFVLVAATMATGVFALPALADDDDLSPARMERLDTRANERGYSITHAKAISIAKANGVVTIKEFDLDDGEWEIEGKDAAGRDIEIDLSARDGKIVEIDRD